MESAGANRLQLVVVEEKRAQMVQVTEAARDYFIDLVEAQVPADNIDTLEKSFDKQHM